MLLLCHLGSDSLSLLNGVFSQLTFDATNDICVFNAIILFFVLHSF